MYNKKFDKFEVFVFSSDLKIINIDFKKNIPQLMSYKIKNQ